MSCLIAGWEAVASSKQMCYSKNHSYSPHKQIFFLKPPPPPLPLHLSSLLEIPV